MLHPGLRLRSGRYRLLSRLRAGATAQVWRALDVRDGVEVAIKAVPADAGGAEAVEHEAEAVARVRHPGAVRVHGTFEEAGHGLIVMDLAACALSDHVEAHGPLDGPTARGVALALADVLAAAHAAGVVHRDVKPQNVLILPDGSARLADFGIARVHARGHTRTSALLGTLPFMAPEQRRDARDVRPATDVYALAALIAWMRTGAPPGDLFVPEVIDALRGRLRAAGEPDDALLDVIVAAGRYAVDERTADGARLAEALRGVGAREEDGRVVAAEGVVPAAGDAGAASHGEADARVGWAGGGPRLPATPPALRTMGLIAAGTATVAMLGVWIGARIASSEPLAGRSGEGTDTLPACATQWNPTSFARTLGPRETVGVAADDLDGDGHVDVVFANQLDESLSIYWGDGAAKLRAPETLAVGRVSAAPAIGDVDGDGRPDLLVPYADRSELRVFRQTTARRFEADVSVTHPDLSPLGPPALLRWDDDALLDVLLVAERGLKIRRGVGKGRFRDEQVEVSAPPVAYAVIRQRAGTDAVLLGGASASLVAAGTGAVVRRLASWPTRFGRPLALGSDMFLHVGPTIVRLARDGAACAYGATDAPIQDLTDLDADAVPEALGFLTCSGCTSNHIVISGG